MVKFWYVSGSYRAIFLTDGVSRLTGVHAPLQEIYTKIMRIVTEVTEKLQSEIEARRDRNIFSTQSAHIRHILDQYVRRTPRLVAATPAGAEAATASDQQPAPAQSAVSPAGLAKTDPPVGLSASVLEAAKGFEIPYVAVDGVAVAVADDDACYCLEAGPGNAETCVNGGCSCACHL